jgi:hypothetical protein
MLGSLYPEQSRNSRAASLPCRVFRISAVQVACLSRCCCCRWVRAFDKQNRGASEGEVWQTHARGTAGMRHREREGETPCELRESFLWVTFLFVSALSMPGSSLFVSVLLKMCYSSGVFVLFFWRGAAGERWCLFGSRCILLGVWNHVAHSLISILKFFYFTLSEVLMSRFLHVLDSDASAPACLFVCWLAFRSDWMAIVYWRMIPSVQMFFTLMFWTLRVFWRVLYIILFSLH